LTELDPERDFGDWRRGRKRTTTDGSADAGATALVELVGVDCPNDCPSHPVDGSRGCHEPH
jgi:hypothetical protein